MKLEYQILAAFALDLICGDPRWLPHPVRFIGKLALTLEQPLRRRISCVRLAGIIAVCIVAGATGISTFLFIKCATALHPIAGDAVSIFILYTAFASHDLIAHSHRVYCALRRDNLVEARHQVSMLVGRDTDSLDEKGVVRAAVESVAENLSDGVTAPILFAVIAGPVGAMVFKAVSTLDSMFGYKDERYLLFGWASARLDDVANYLPARLTAPLVALAAAILGYRPWHSMRIFLRDGRKHPSPNAGLSEAAMAGALGVQLGGVNYYGGEAFEGAHLGDALQPLSKQSIRDANLLALAASFLGLLVLVGIRVLLFRLCRKEA
jgi:adenosylcobinamide-phosphate synthase